MKEPFQNKETLFLIETARIYLGTAPPDDFSSRNFDDLNLSRLIDSGLRHGLLFLVYKTLKKHFQNETPPGFLETMGNKFLKNTARNLSLSASLIKLLNLFQQNNIEVIPFKGPVQAQLLYGDIGMRPFSDLDLLVKKADALAARSLLCENGFSQRAVIPENQTAYFLKKENFFQFADPDGKIDIDLHWELSGRYTNHSIYYPADNQSLREMTFLDQQILTLCPEDMLLHLCIHGSSHCWEKLEMIFSVARIVKDNTEIDWERIYRKSKNIGCRKMVFFGLLIAGHYFRIDLPEIFHPELKKNTFKKLLVYVTRKIDMSTRSFSEQLNWRFSPFHFRIRDNFPDALIYFFRLLFQPTIKEWELFSLPDRLLFLYYIIRPYRLLKEGIIKTYA